MFFEVIFVYMWIAYSEMGARSCGPLFSCVPVLLNFSFAFPRSCTTFFLRSPAFLFLVPSVCVGVGEQLITRALFVYGRIRRAGSIATALLPSPRHACAVYEYTGREPVWGQTRDLFTIPLSTSPLSTCHNCVISSQEFSVPIISRSRDPV